MDKCDHRLCRGGLEARGPFVFNRKELKDHKERAVQIRWNYLLGLQKKSLTTNTK
jgi:hypothetical protein